jgi:hypothetical protein
LGALFPESRLQHVDYLPRCSKEHETKMSHMALYQTVRSESPQRHTVAVLVEKAESSPGMVEQEEEKELHGMFVGVA